MTFASIISSVSSRSNSRASTSELGFRIVAVLWVLYLFTPHKLLQYYVPETRPLTWILEILLLAGTALLVVNGRDPGARPRGYPAFTIFFLLTVFGLAMASVYGDLGRAREVLREIYQFYLLALLTFAYCDTSSRAKTIFKIYFWHFVYFGVWGVISLIRTPIIDGVDPGFRDIVYWHVHYGNRDAFGPLMAAGLTYSAYYFQALIPRPKAALAGMALNLLGIITSFGRGVFLSLLAATGMMWLRAKHKGRILAVVLACAAVMPIVAPGPTLRYAASMGTIFTEGSEKGTGADRKVLWAWAWRVFKLNPIAGVGPLNFGIAVFDVVSPQEAAQHEYTRNRLYGRVLHSMPMTILCEYGILGVLAMLFLIGDFFRTNAAIRRVGRDETAVVAGFTPGYVTAIGFGLQCAFITICINSVFYEILYTSILWYLITLNRLLYFACGADAPAPNSAPIPSPRVGEGWGWRTLATRRGPAESRDPETRGTASQVAKFPRLRGMFS